MRNLVLGIIAVICLDVGFIVYIKIDNLADAASAAINAVASDANPVIKDRVDTPQPIDPGAVLASVRRGSLHHETIVAIEIRRPAARAENRGPANLYALRKPTAPKILDEIAIKPRVERKPTILETVAKDSRKPEKRSFIATSLAIVKKPWDWIKAIGSKLR